MAVIIDVLMVLIAKLIIRRYITSLEGKTERLMALDLKTLRAFPRETHMEDEVLCTLCLALKQGQEGIICSSGHGRTGISRVMTYSETDRVSAGKRERREFREWKERSY